MLRLWNSFTAVLLFALTAMSCGFVDLRPIGYVIEPDVTDSVLTDSYSPVIIKFDTEMEKYDVEKILQVTSAN